MWAGIQTTLALLPVEILRLCCNDSQLRGAERTWSKKLLIDALMQSQGTPPTEATHAA